MHWDRDAPAPLQGDFNLSKILEEQQLGGAAPGSSMSGALNPIWLAPEVVRGDRATAESDVYSFGVVLYEASPPASQGCLGRQLGLMVHGGLQWLAAEGGSGVRAVAYLVGSLSRQCPLATAAAQKVGCQDECQCVSVKACFMLCQAWVRHNSTLSPLPPTPPGSQLLTWQLPWGGMAPFKIMQAVLAGERPVVPPLDALPGSDTASFIGLDSYMELMR